MKERNVDWISFTLQVLCLAKTSMSFLGNHGIVLKEVLCYGKRRKGSRSLVKDIMVTRNSMALLNKYSQKECSLRSKSQFLMFEKLMEDYAVIFSIWARRSMKLHFLQKLTKFP